MDNWIGVAVALGTGIIFILVGIPLMRRSIAPNTLYGYRTRRTLSDPAVWYEVNAVSGKHLSILGVILVIVGVIGVAARNDPRQQEMLAWAAVAVMAIGLIYSIFTCHQLSKSLSAMP